MKRMGWEVQRRDLKKQKTKFTYELETDEEDWIGRSDERS